MAIRSRPFSHRCSLGSCLLFSVLQQKSPQLQAPALAILARWSPLVAKISPPFQHPSRPTPTKTVGPDVARSDALLMQQITDIDI